MAGVHRHIAAALRPLLLGIATTLIVAGTLSALASHRQPPKLPALRYYFENVNDGYLIFETYTRQWRGAKLLSWRLDRIVSDRTVSDAIPIPRDPTLPAWSSLRDPRARNTASVFISSGDWLAGWPALAFRGPLIPDSLSNSRQLQFHGGMLLVRGSPQSTLGSSLRLGGTLLPLIPLWPGFLIDTLFYAAAWWTLIASLAAIRRFLRRRRNHCPHCNYDLRATPSTQPCPECGHQRTAPR